MLGLQWVEVRSQRIIICSDSVAALNSLSSTETIRDYSLKRYP